MVLVVLQATPQVTLCRADLADKSEKTGSSSSVAAAGFTYARLFLTYHKGLFL